MEAANCGTSVREVEPVLDDTKLPDERTVTYLFRKVCKQRVLLARESKTGQTKSRLVVVRGGARARFGRLSDRLGVSVRVPPTNCTAGRQQLLIVHREQVTGHVIRATKAPSAHRTPAR